MSDVGPRPKNVQLAELIGGLGLAFLLLISAITLGQIALSFGIDVVLVIMESGLEEGFQRLSSNIQTLAIKDLGPEVFRILGDQSLSNGIAWIFSTIAAFLAPVLYAYVWIGLARLSFSLVIRGMWGLQGRDHDEDEVGPLPDTAYVSKLLLAEDFQKERLSHEDRVLLKKSARFTPHAFVNLQKQLRAPALKAIRPLVWYAFWGILTAVFLALTLATITGESSFLLSALLMIKSTFGTVFGLPAATLALVLTAMAALSAFMDVKFARALSPKMKPAADKQMEMLRDLVVNMPPAQFNSVLKSELAIKLNQIRYTYIGLDDTKDGFVDQSSFFLEVLIEGEAHRTENYANRASIRRLIFGVTSIILGALLPLILIFPSAIRDLLQFRDFSLLEGSMSPVWMALAIVAGRSIRSIGLRAISTAEQVLVSEWYTTPVVSVRFDGTVNTQTALTGRSIEDSYGSENRVQQSRLDARVMSASILGVSVHEAARQEIFSFTSDTDSSFLHDAVNELLRHEGSHSTFSAVTKTISDNQNIAEATELRKAELKLQIAKTQAELKMIESDAQKLSDPSEDNESS